MGLSTTNQSDLFHHCSSETSWVYLQVFIALFFYRFILFYGTPVTPYVGSCFLWEVGGFFKMSRMYHSWCFLHSVKTDLSPTGRTNNTTNIWRYSFVLTDLWQKAPGKWQRQYIILLYHTSGGAVGLPAANIHPPKKMYLNVFGELMPKKIKKVLIVALTRLRDNHSLPSCPRPAWCYLDQPKQQQPPTPLFVS